jgi:hypothetical protein
MSLTATPMGLRPIGRTGAGGQEVFTQYPIASAYNTNIAIGDVVNLVDNGTTTTIAKQSGTGDTTTNIDMVGIFMGCSYTDPTLGYTLFSTMWPANTVASNAMAFVVDNPDVEFVIQGNAAASNPGDVYGKNAALVQTAPNTTFKVSRVTLNLSTLGTDANLPIRILDYLGGARGDEAGTAFPLLRCRFNYHQHRNPGT